MTKARIANVVRGFILMVHDPQGSLPNPKDRRSVVRSQPSAAYLSADKEAES